MVETYLLTAVFVCNILGGIYFMRVHSLERKDLKKIAQQHSDNAMILEEIDYPVELQLKEIHDALGTQLKEELHKHISFEEQEEARWQKLIKETEDKKLKSAYIEAAFYRHPNNNEFFNAFYNRLSKDLETSSLDIQKVIIGKLNHLTQQFINQCEVKDIEYAYEKEQEVVQLSERYIKEAVTFEEEKVKVQLAKLEDLIYNKASLEEIQHFDTLINKVVLEKNPSHLERYTKLLQQVTHKVTGEPTSEQLLKYNKEAIYQAKTAEQEINKYHKSLKRGDDQVTSILRDLTSRLGGWENYYLTDATQTYMQTVYAQLFSVLEPSLKSKLTTDMLLEQKKEIFR